MSIVAAALAAVKAIQIPFTLLSLINEGLRPNNVNLQNNSSYDYVIVGGGTAGLVLATRLSEDRKCTVIVLEAGPDPPVDAFLAALFVLLPESNVDYNYTSTYDRRAAGSQNNRTKLTAGKMLGGSASMNHFLALRGAKIDFNTWAKIAKDRTWSYKEVLPYFIKSEKIKDAQILNTNRNYHGTNGPTGMTRELHDESETYLNAFAQVNNPTVLDLNGNVSVGYTQSLYTIADKLRQTPAYSYLRLVKNFANLIISKNTVVTKVLTKNKKAIGVEADFNKKKYTIRARKEVILCAGVFNTPQLLMLSGIGPAGHLKSLSIPVISDLPVGNNLIDQVAVNIVFNMGKSAPVVPVLDPTKIPFPVFVGQSAVKKTQKYPDYQTFGLLFPPDSPFLVLACSVVFGYRDEICKRLNSEVKFSNVFYALIAHSQPKSRGNVRLASTNPFVPPLITTGYYTNKTDLNDMVTYIKDFLKVRNSDYFKKVNAKLVGLDLPECSTYTKGSRRYWKCYILNMSVSPYHYTSTCPIGSVVNSQLKVYGVKRLRIVDASVMPTIPRSPPQPAVLMVAEKAASFILNGK